MAFTAGKDRTSPGSEASPAGTSGGLLEPRLGILLVLLGGCGLSFSLMRGVELSGDETFYAETAAHVARCMLGRHGDVPLSRLVDPIVGNGWFVPGMAVLLAPVQLLFGGEAPVAWLRGWAIAVNGALLATIGRVLSRSGIPPGYVLVGLAASFLVPFYACFLGCLWGELIAAHAAILVMLLVERRIVSFGVVTGALVGAAIGLVTLSRPQFFLLLALVGLRAGLAFTDGVLGAPRKLCGGLLALVASWCAVVAPWELALQSRYGPFFLTVSPAEQPFVGDAHYRTNHRLTGEPWQAVHDELVAEAARNDRSLHRQIQISSVELTRLSFSARVTRQAEQARKFYFDENRFLERFQRLDRAAAVPDVKWGWARLVNPVTWRACLAVGMLMLLVPFAAGASLDYRMPLVFKGLAGLVAVQPLVYAAHGRYHVALVPIVSVFTAVALAASTRVRGGARASRVVLLAVQVVSVAFVVVTAWLLLRSD